MEVMGNQGNLIWTKFQKIQPMHKMSITEVHKLIMKKNVIDSVGLLKNVVANYAKSSFIMSWILLFTTDACGGNGGNGGNGAEAGSLKLLSTSNASIMVINTRVRSNGGSSGTGGVQASGLKCNRHFKGYMRYWPSNVCSGAICRHCVNTQYHEEFGNYGYTNNDKDCPGLHGVNGISGNNWEP